MWKAGDLNKFFDNVIANWTAYEPVVHSSPHLDTAGPWVITLENFVTEEESDQLIKLGNARGYDRSEDVGEMKFDGSFTSVRSENRTSTNTWCLDECFNDTLVQQVLNRIENLTGVPGTNSEYLQLLHYNVSIVVL